MQHNMITIQNMHHNAAIIKHVQHSHGISHEHDIPSASYSIASMQYTEAIHQAQYKYEHRETTCQMLVRHPTPKGVVLTCKNEGRILTPISNTSNQLKHLHKS